MIDKSTIDTIFSVARVEEVVGDFVSLKKRGANYIGLCPFHHEKTPSFIVSPTKGIYKCFGCGKAGNAVNFVMELEKYSFPEALKYIAKKYGIQIVEKEYSPEEQEKIDLKEKLFNANSFAQDYFSKILNEDEEGRNIGLSYFKERGFTEKTIEKFKLGYSPDKFNSFYNYAKTHGYQDDVLKEAGLITITDNGSILDKFRGRVIFPIHNLTGRILGFGGRIMSSNKKTAKYLNSPETPIYNKSATLYGIYFAKSAIVSLDFCYLVEGYTDVMTMHQAGIENVVASSGTSLTTEQIRLIKRYTKNITVIYDGDNAGIKASLRGINMILEEGLNVKIIPLPEGEDPDSFVSNNSSSIVEDYFNQKQQDFIKFKTNLLLNESDNDPIKKVNIIKDIVDTIALIPDHITKSIYIKECSELLDIKEQSLLFELNKVINKKHRDIKRQNESEPLNEEINEFAISSALYDDKENSLTLLENSFEVLERSIIEKLLKFGDQLIEIEEDTTDDVDDINNNTSQKNKTKILAASYIIHEILEDEIIVAHLTNPLYKDILLCYSAELKKGNIPNDKFFINHENTDFSQTAINLIAERYSVSENWSKSLEMPVIDESHKIQETVFRAVYSYKAAIIKKLRYKLQETMKNEKNHLKLIELLKIDVQYKETEIYINKLLDRIIT